jgi:hypothetical protein
MVSFSGLTFRAVEAAARELDRHSLQIEKYKIVVETSPTTITVCFLDPDRAPTQLGSGPNLTEFEVEVDGGTLAVTRSNFVK